MRLLRTETETKYTIAAVEKAAAVLLSFLQPPTSLGVSEVARRVGVNKNQAFRLLATLEQAGLLVRADGGPEYRLGWRVVELGHVAASGISLQRIARPIAAQLAEETAETILLVSFDGVEAVGIDRWESPHAIRLSADIGQRFPLHAGACPKAILAALPVTQGHALVEREGYIAYTDKTARSWEQLVPELEEIRRTRYALSRGDIVEGAEAVGAAIHDGAGRVVGAISIAGPDYRFLPRFDEYAARVRKVAADISAQLGGERL